jgi:hypothetical protein
MRLSLPCAVDRGHVSAYGALGAARVVSDIIYLIDIPVGNRREGKGEPNTSHTSSTCSRDPSYRKCHRMILSRTSKNDEPSDLTTAASGITFMTEPPLQPYRYQMGRRFDLGKSGDL